MQRLLQITALTKEWLQLTRLESQAIRNGRWSDAARIQKSKDAVRQPLEDAVVRWKIEFPADVPGNPFHLDFDRLFALESANSQLLAVRKREVREKLLVLEQLLYDLRRICSPREAAAQEA